MAYTNVEALKGKDGPVYLWRITDFYDGLQSQAMIRGSYPSTSGNDETRQANYAAPWSEDLIPVHTYWNEGRMQALAQLNIFERGAFLLNNAGSGITSRTIELLNGTKIYVQDAQPQLSIRDAGGNLIASYQDIGYGTNYYNNALYLMVDDLAQAAFFGVIYYNPTYEHGGSRQYCGFALDGRTNDPDDRDAVYNALTGNFYVSDPYAPGGESQASGPAAGNFDNTSDTITVPAVPALNLSLNHFISAYVPSLTDINDLADFMWGNYDKTDSNKVLSKIFADPTDAIISLHMLPFTPGSSTAIPVTIGRYATSLSFSPMTAQFTDITCGSLTIEPYWGNYLDYVATSITLFLPYVGEVNLDPNEVMGETVSVTYRVDNLTGAFVCFIATADKVLAQYNGCCALSVPVSAADYRQLNGAILSAAMAAVGGALTVAGAGASLAAGAAEGSIGSLNLAGAGISAAANVAQSKVHHSHSGALGGAAGFLGSQTPYLIIHRARQCLPAGLNERAGYPSMITARLGDQYGFTSVSSIILDGLPYTDEELSELAGILKEGFIA